MFKRIPGTRDILPEEAEHWRSIEETSRKVFRNYNYKEIRPPYIEQANLFCRSLGGSSEIVQKQMFLIKKEDDLYALRPEGTASIVRAYIENDLDKTEGFIKLYYMGPMFRLERPQKGRLRQFHHIGCEAIGSGEPSLDVEVLSLADTLLKGFSIEGHKINLNSLGCPDDKKRLAEELRTFFKSRINGLCADCRIRYERNVLRILDCKEEPCRKAVRELDLSQKYLCRECQVHFDTVRNGLDSLGLKYEVAPYLVRGLDYYTRTVFEITHANLGAQDALGAGGRYDGLVAGLGGPQAGAIGFAFGVERLFLVTKSEGHQVTSKDLVYVITIGEEARKAGLKLLNEVRRADICADTDYESKSLKGAMRKANDLCARYVLIIGEDELKKNALTLKDMASGEQTEISQSKLIADLSRKLV